MGGKWGNDLKRHVRCIVKFVVNYVVSILYNLFKYIVSSSLVVSLNTFSFHMYLYDRLPRLFSTYSLPPIPQLNVNLGTHPFSLSTLNFTEDDKKYPFLKIKLSLLLQ